VNSGGSTGSCGGSRPPLYFGEETMKTKGGKRNEKEEDKEDELHLRMLLAGFAPGCE